MAIADYSKFQHTSGDAQTINAAGWLISRSKFEYGTVVLLNAVLCRFIPRSAKQDAPVRREPRMHRRDWELFWQAECQIHKTRVRCTASPHLYRALQELLLQAQIRSSLRSSGHL